MPELVAARTALVSGANRGIGRHLALGLAAAGCDIGLLGRRRDALEAAADACREAGARAAVAVADVVDRDQVTAAVAEIEDGLGAVDVLVNNAGAIEHAEGSYADSDVEDMWRVVEVNLRGPMLTTHAVLPGMLARGSGRIVNLNSGFASKRVAAYTGYAVSKGALARFTALLDAQYRDRGLRAFDVAPGVIATDMSTGMPMHEGRTEWTPLDALVDLVVGLARGELDALAGRFFRAGTDTLESLLSNQAAIVDSDARVLRLAPIGVDDPVT